mgnify:CR=1 FL=1
MLSVLLLLLILSVLLLLFCSGVWGMYCDDGPGLPLVWFGLLLECVGLLWFTVVAGDPSLLLLLLLLLVVVILLLVVVVILLLVLLLVGDVCGVALVSTSYIVVCNWL